MKILRLTLANFATIGVNRKLLLQPYPVNAKIFTGFLIIGAWFILNFVYIVFQAKTFAEYIQGTYIFSLAVLIILALVIIIFNVKKLFQLIDFCENLINTSM